MDAAAEQFQALLTDQVRVLGPDRPSTLGTRNSLALSLHDSGQVAAAAEQFQALLTDRARVLGSDHRDTLITRNGLALSLRASGQV